VISLFFLRKPTKSGIIAKYLFGGLRTHRYNHFLSRSIIPDRKINNYF